MCMTLLPLSAVLEVNELIKIKIFFFVTYTII